MKYEDIDWAGSTFASAGLAFQNFSISAGKIVNAGASFTKGTHNVPIHLSHTSPYELEIHHARSINVVIYDVKDRRSWLVDGASALLHLTRTQLSSEPYASTGLLDIGKFRYADPKAGASGAKQALLDPQNREICIFEDSKTTTELKITVEGATEQETRKVTNRWTYGDLVQQTYHILEQIEDRQIQMLASPSINLHVSPREKLLGYGFMDIVDGRNILLPRVATLKRSGWGWVDFTRSIKAIALLGKGFGDMIAPTGETTRLCKYWSRVPTGQDYLVTCISTLEDISRQHGDRDPDVLQLANGISWHKPDKLFESCECESRMRKMSCDRLQVPLPHCIGLKRPLEPFATRSGAVIFGRSRKLRWRWPSSGEPFEGGESEIDGEEDGEHTDSGLGESISSTSVSASANIDTPPSDGSLNVANIIGLLQEARETEAQVESQGGEIQDVGQMMQEPDERSSAAISAKPKMFQMISRGVKRQLDKVHPQLPRKKAKISSDIGNAEHDFEEILED